MKRPRWVAAVAVTAALGLAMAGRSIASTTRASAASLGLQRAAGALWPATVPAADMLPHAVVHLVTWGGDPWARQVMTDVRASLAHPWTATAGLGVSTPTLGSTLTMPPPRGTTGMAVQRSFVAWERTYQPAPLPEPIYVLPASIPHLADACGWHTWNPGGTGAVAVIPANPGPLCGGQALVVATVTHELVEAATDPGDAHGQYLGWHTTAGGSDDELADVCSNQTYRVDGAGEVIDPADIQILDPHTGRCVWLWHRLHINPMVATTVGGTWTASADGAVVTTGTAGFYGSMAGRPLASPIVGIAATPNGKGYWLVGRDGGVFAFGDAPFYGSLPQAEAGGMFGPSINLNSPVVQIVAGVGHLCVYHVVARNGNAYCFTRGGYDYVDIPPARTPLPVIGIVLSTGEQVASWWHRILANHTIYHGVDGSYGGGFVA